MKKPARTGSSRRQPGRPGTEKPIAPTAAAPAVQPPAVLSSGTPGAGPVDQLTPEEQMERFAKELKNNDWGHQPC